MQRLLLIYWIYLVGVKGLHTRPILRFIVSLSSIVGFPADVAQVEWATMAKKKET